MGIINKAKSLVFGESDDRGRPWSTRSVFDFKHGLHRDLGKFNDPTFLGFFFLFQPNSPLLDTSDFPGVPGTAYYYLNKIGETARAQYIKALSEIIRDLNQNMPWYFQSIEGLDNAFKYNNVMDGYQGGDDAQLTINTLESIDLKITQVIELYRLATYDFKYRREILPENLRKFRLWIWVSEMRKFQVLKSLVGMAAKGQVNIPGVKFDAIEKWNNAHQNPNEISDPINNNAPWLLFRLDECEFVTDESNGYLGTISMSEPAIAENKLVLKYQNSDYDYGPNLGADLLARLNAIQGPEGGYIGADGKFDTDKFKDAMLDKAKKMGQDAAFKAAANLEGVVVGAVEGFIESLYLGNAHGFSPSGVIDKINQTSVSSLAAQVGNMIRNNNLDGISEGVKDFIHGSQPENNDEQLSGSENVHGN